MAMRCPPVILNSKLSNWVLRIKESSSSGKWNQVISHYHEMKIAGVQPFLDISLFPLILKAYSRLPHNNGKSLHATLIKQGNESYTYIGNSIMSFYFKSGELDSATSVFYSMRCRDSVSWNILIHGYLDHGFLIDALRLFTSATIAGFEPNISTLVLVIQACRSLRIKHEALQLHCYMIRSGLLGSCSIKNSLICMYADEDMKYARKLFDEMPEKDVISWSVMIGGYVQNLEPQFGLQMFQEMISIQKNNPDEVIIVCVLKACANSVSISMGRTVHGLTIFRGLDFDLFVKNSLIDMYSNCHDIGSAFSVFNEISLWNNVSWNSMLSGLLLNGNYSEALFLIHSMQNEGIEADEVTLVNILQICKYFANPYQLKAVHCVILGRGCESNELAASSLIDAYAKCNLVEYAWNVFIRTRGRDVVLWSTMIAAFARCGKPDEAIAVFQEMDKAVEVPNAVATIHLLEACSASGELNKAKWAHGVAIRRNLAAEVAVGTAIVDMYSKCGEIEASRKAFTQIPNKNIVTWSAMISAYGMNGLAREALAMLDEMKIRGIRPNSLTILSALSACSHGGLIEEGISVFKSMVEEHGIEPGMEHYSCVVDMLSRAGKLDSAMELIEIMPKSLKNDASVWGAILSACRNYGNCKLGEKAASRVLELEPLNSAGYLLASGMYGADGSWVDAARMRLLGKERGMRVVAGNSLMPVDSKAYRISCCSHPPLSDLQYSS
ncbi:pentatricopeptide repeat-containing protein At2g17210 [Euphorbia lathyris]|uniref:pentatricopeptide repeat-containing protein At2g17210 n=1 Tax=Euphorbia lathyris TaxID=212925 RepID=UPI00331398F3